METFKPNDIVYWRFNNGDKSPCTVLDVLKDDQLRVIWHKDEFVNIMPSRGFIKGEKDEEF